MESSHTFKINIVFLTLYFIFIHFIIISGYILYIVYDTVYNVELTMYFIMLAAASFAYFIITFVLSNIFKVTIESKGLHGTNIFGMNRKIVWQDITDVKYLNLFGLTYLRIFSSRLRFPIWLPLFIKNKGEFRQLLKTFYSEHYKFIRHIE